MKTFEIKALGLEEMSSKEVRTTEGGSLLVGILCIAATLLVSTCVQINVTVGDDNTVNNGEQSAKEGGTDVNTDVSVVPKP